MVTVNYVVFPRACGSNTRNIFINTMYTYLYYILYFIMYTAIQVYLRHTQMEPLKTIITITITLISLYHRAEKIMIVHNHIILVTVDRELNNII